MPRARRSEAPTQAQQSAWRDCVRLPEGCNEISIGMCGWGMTDQDMATWCEWFASHIKKVRGKDGERLVAKDINFSNNQLTAAGLRSLLVVLCDLDISPVVIRMHHNRLSAGAEIASRLVRGGLLRELHLSHNDFDTASVMAIIYAAASAKDEQGEFRYPTQTAGRSAAPLWMRLEQNLVDSELLQERVEEASRHLQRPGRILCSVTDKRCTPHSCNKHRHDPPAIHAKILANQQRSLAASELDTPLMRDATSAATAAAAACAGASSSQIQKARARPEETSITTVRPERLPPGRTRGRAGIRGEPIVPAGGGGSGGSVANGATAASAASAVSADARRIHAHAAASASNAAAGTAVSSKKRPEPAAEAAWADETDGDGGDDSETFICVDVLRWDDAVASWVKDTIEVPKKPPLQSEHDRFLLHATLERKKTVASFAPSSASNIPVVPTQNASVLRTAPRGAIPAGAPRAREFNTDIFALLGQNSPHQASALVTGPYEDEVDATLPLAGTAAAKSRRRRAQPSGCDVKQGGKGSPLNAGAREFVPGAMEVPTRTSGTDNALNLEDPLNQEDAISPENALNSKDPRHQEEALSHEKALSLENLLHPGEVLDPKNSLTPEHVVNPEDEDPRRAECVTDCFPSAAASSQAAEDTAKSDADAGDLGGADEDHNADSTCTSCVCDRDSCTSRPHGHDLAAEGTSAEGAPIGAVTLRSVLRGLLGLGAVPRDDDNATDGPAGVPAEVAAGAAADATGDTSMSIDGTGSGTTCANAPAGAWRLLPVLVVSAAAMLGRAAVAARRRSVQMLRL